MSDRILSSVAELIVSPYSVDDLASLLVICPISLSTVALEAAGKLLRIGEVNRPEPISFSLEELALVFVPILADSFEILISRRIGQGLRSAIIESAEAVILSTAPVARVLDSVILEEEHAVSFSSPIYDFAFVKLGIFVVEPPKTPVGAGVFDSAVVLEAGRGVVERLSRSVVLAQLHGLVLLVL